MLSAQKFLSTMRCSLCYSCSSSIARHALRFRPRNIGRNYGQWVPESLLLDEEAKAKYAIDPKVKALSQKLIHSDYLQRKTLNFGERENRKLLSAMGTKARRKKQEDVMQAPVISVALKYFKENDEGTAEIMDQDKFEQNKNAESEAFADSEKSTHASPSKSLYMPYAVKDSYEKAEDTESPEDSEISDLNPEIMDRYEKYLAGNDPNFPRDLEDVEVSKDESYVDSYRSALKSLGSVPTNWMNDYEQFAEMCEEDAEHAYYGTPNVNIPVSSIPCGGCGAPLHCQDPALPGYLPSELFKGQKAEMLRSTICQRCHFIKNYKTMLDVTVSPDELPALLSHIKKKPVAVIFMIDLTDFPCSIWTGLKSIVNKRTQIFVVGNKVDLLPYDEPNFQKKVELRLIDALKEMGLGELNIKSINLVSAKTGYGIEELINRLHKHWEYKGDAYLIGCTNVGKSSLFNALLRSDYCKIQATDLVQRATVSLWPGTTLNLLKFPILNPIRERLWMRTQRLMAQRREVQGEAEFRIERYKDTKKVRLATLQGRIGQTFASSRIVEGPGYIAQPHPQFVNPSGHLGLNENYYLYKNSRWCYDTPGAILPDQILHLLTTQELMLTLPRKMISPRTFIFRKSQTLFIAGLGRLDYYEGPQAILCTVFASDPLPVTICSTEYADEIYRELLRSEAFVVPINDPERLKLFPEMKSKTVKLSGVGFTQSAADIVLSNAGWIALTADENCTAEFEAWTPEGRGIHLRTPALLDKSVRHRGYRISRSQVFSRGRRIYLPR